MTTKGNLSALVKPRSRGNGDIVGAKSREPIPSVKGLSERKVESDNRPTQQGGGIASPLREVSRKVSEYTDGQHTYRVAVESTFEDVEGNRHVFTYLPPDSVNIEVIE